MIKRRNIRPHIRKKGEKPLIGKYKGKPRRWVVERTNSWHNRFRAILIRWERKGQCQQYCVNDIALKRIQSQSLSEKNRKLIHRLNSATRSLTSPYPQVTVW
ncbi:transposase DDE domain protein [Leptospira weilii str. Ecochallenge]|uniref:Transposase DDE domain protein n=1 Tax=Leptospira weilii str. Ecochallenge TaxID=1049986 RepID=N1UCP8_9LEPT|nr:transposase DDE domain protein [Leptospira weilii str. Ecochallenge]